MISLKMTHAGEPWMLPAIRWQAGTLALLWLLAGMLAPAAGATETTDTTAAYIEQAQIAFDRADIIGAIGWYRKAAELDDATAQTRLAYLLDSSEANEEAVEWYRRAAEQDSAEAKYGLAKMIASGEGVAQDFQQALDWYTQAARQGYHPAIRVLALVNEKGQLGLAINYAQAVSWLNAGAATNDTWSIQRLAQAYRRGELGLRIDREQAALLESRLPADTPAAASGE
ncbi:MAG: sel1 repeat family protein [Gammaproteobacteria bacterium]|nr:sel1 repeat family protein [Gammaproteobacteria bacterium]MDH3560167.1 sel1 repeat family protein [Gammaproteobacteria bacterium]